MGSLRWADGPSALIHTPAYLAKDPAQAKKDPYIYAASLMALHHNQIIRGLNSIFLQAAHIQFSEVNDFVNYALCWCQGLRDHHDIEEEFLFPEIEKYTEQGIMEVNVKQHDQHSPEAFLEPLTKMETYLTKAKAAPSEFSGQALCDMISAFAPVLHTHLQDEIPSLVGLQKYGDTLPITDLISQTASKSAAAANRLTTGIFFVLNVDITFEEGMWADWPPIPLLVRHIPLRAMMWYHRRCWKFASCSIDGKPKGLGEW